MGFLGTYSFKKNKGSFWNEWQQLPALPCWYCLLCQLFCCPAPTSLPDFFFFVSLKFWIFLSLKFWYDFLLTTSRGRMAYMRPCVNKWPRWERVPSTLTGGYWKALDAYLWSGAFRSCDCQSVVTWSKWTSLRTRQCRYFYVDFWNWLYVGTFLMLLGSRSNTVAVDVKG